MLVVLAVSVTVQLKFELHDWALTVKIEQIS